MFSLLATLLMNVSHVCYDEPAQMTDVSLIKIKYQYTTVSEYCLFSQGYWHDDRLNVTLTSSGNKGGYTGLCVAAVSALAVTYFIYSFICLFICISSPSFTSCLANLWMRQTDFD